MAKEEGDSHFSSADRLLINRLNDVTLKMDVKVDRLISDVADINRNYGARIEKLEQEKLAKNEAEKLIATATEEAYLKSQLLEGKVALLQKIVYGCAGSILLGFIGAVITGVFKKG